MNEHLVLVVLVFVCLLKIGMLTSESCFPARCSDRNRSSILNPALLLDNDFQKSPCFCDDDCNSYDDCCSDRSLRGTKNKWICDSLPGDYKHEFIYMVGSCPETWLEERTVKLCQKDVLDSEYSYLLDVPVVSFHSKLFYSNLFCARCHGETRLKQFDLNIRLVPGFATSFLNYNLIQNISKLAKYMPGERVWYVPPSQNKVMTFTFPAYILKDFVKAFFKPRPCKPVTSICLPTYGRSDASEKCPLYNNYIEVNSTLFKNKHCALCNEMISTEHSPVCYLIPKRASSRNQIPSFSLLFDFGNGKGCVGCPCHSGQFLDPLSKNCVSLECGVLYEKVDGRCVLKDSDYNDRNSTYIRSACPTQLVSSDDVFLLNDGSIFVNSTKKVYRDGDFELYNQSWYRVCVDELHLAKFSAVQSRLSTVTLTISMCCLAMHITVHLFLPKLRNLPGKILLSLSITLFLGQIVFFVGVNRTSIRELCIFTAIVIHYTFLTAFFWMNIMAFDVYRTFASLHNRMRSQATKSKTFIKYSIYAWFVPMAVVTVAVIVENTNIISDVRPFYGQKFCWFGSRKGLLVFFIMPIAILLLVNIIFFVLTSYAIHQTAHMVACNRRSTECVRFYLYVKLAVIMGLAWIFGFVAAIAEIEALWYVFIFFNALQGAFIFVFFTLKRKVFEHLYEKITGKPLPVPNKTVTSSVNLRSSSRRSSSSRLFSRSYKRSVSSAQEPKA